MLVAGFYRLKPDLQTSLTSHNRSGSCEETFSLLALDRCGSGVSKRILPSCFQLAEFSVGINPLYLSAEAYPGTEPAFVRPLLQQTKTLQLFLFLEDPEVLISEHHPHSPRLELFRSVPSTEWP